MSLTPLTVPEARVIIFLAETLAEVARSLRFDQIAALVPLLDPTQKILLLEISTVSSKSLRPDAVLTTDQMSLRAAWEQLVISAEDRYASWDPGKVIP